MDTDRKNADEMKAYNQKVDLITAWEIINKVPFEERLTYWFGDYGMDAPKYEHRDKIGAMYDHIMSEGHSLLNTGSGAAVYRQSEEYARAHGELEAYRDSEKQNASCAGAIDLAVQASRTTLYRYDGESPAESVDGYDLEDAARSVAAEYGQGRTAWVLANAILEKKHDGRLSYANRQWARAFPIPVEHKTFFDLNTPVVILDVFTCETRKIFEVELWEHAPITLPSEKPSVLDQLREARKNPMPQSTKKDMAKDATEIER